MKRSRADQLRGKGTKRNRRINTDSFYMVLFLRRAHPVRPATVGIMREHIEHPQNALNSIFKHIKLCLRHTNLMTVLFIDKGIRLEII